MQNNTTPSQPISTDATKFKDKTGAAIIFNEEVHKYRNHPYSSRILQPRKSFDIIIDIGQYNSNFIISTDSQSNLQSLGKLIH